MPRGRAIAAPGGGKRARALRSIHAGTAAVVLSVRAFFEREMRNRRAELRDRPAERTALATGLSTASVSRVCNDVHRAALPGEGATETRRSARRVPAEELARLREAIYSQYHNRTLPTLDSTLEVLSGAEETGPDAAGGAEGSGGERYIWTRATVHRALQDIGFSFSRGPNHYDVARESPSVRRQRNDFIDTVRKYRAEWRTIYYTDETWLNKNMTTYCSWNDGDTRTRMNVPSGKGARIIVAHVALARLGSWTVPRGCLWARRTAGTTIRR